MKYGRRVVVTGMGIVCPLGDTLGEVWGNLIAGRSGARVLDDIDMADMPSRIGCTVARNGEGYYDSSPWIAPRERRRGDPYIAYAGVAAGKALVDAGLLGEPGSAGPNLDELDCNRDRIGVIIGSGSAGVIGTDTASILTEARKVRRVSPFAVPYGVVSSAAAFVAIHYGLYGPCQAISTACATGAHAIGNAARMIAINDADFVLAGGSESPICRVSYAGFSACRALSRGYNDNPEAASRPFDRDRDGFVMGEGSAVLVLEAYDHAVERGARIYAEISGYGQSSDGYHPTMPAPDGRGIRQAMRMCLDDAGVDYGGVDYINAHATSTPNGDEIELVTLDDLFGGARESEPISVSSTKSMTGHLLGAAGAAEAIFSLLVLSNDQIPPTLNLHNPCFKTSLDLVGLESRRKNVGTVLSNSFGFGGMNATLLFRAAESKHPF